MTRTIVIGIGNPVISDDAVGLVVARQLRRELPDEVEVAITEVYDGGFNLMETMIGYDRAFLVDAIVSGALPGTIARLQGEQIGSCRNITTSHHGSLAVALELARAAGLRVPSDVRVWAVEAANVARYHESLTPDVQAAVARVTEEIARELSRAATS